jgi:hypothetical protein
MVACPRHYHLSCHTSPSPFLVIGAKRRPPTNGASFVERDQARAAEVECVGGVMERQIRSATFPPPLVIENGEIS